MSVPFTPPNAQVNIPVIVESATFIGQVGALSARTIYTPIADGVYQLSYYLANSAASGVAAVTPVLTFTDDFNSETVNLYATGSGFGQTNSQCTGASFTFKAKAGQAIQISTTVGSGSTPTYNLYATLVQL